MSTKAQALWDRDNKDHPSEKKMASYFDSSTAFTVAVMILRSRS